MIWSISVNGVSGDTRRAYSNSMVAAYFSDFPRQRSDIAIRSEFFLFMPSSARVLSFLAR